MKFFTSLIFLFTFAMVIFGQSAPPLETGVSQDLAKWRAAHYSDVRYKLNITLEKGAPLMHGTIEVSVKLTDEGARNDLVLDWRTTQFQNDKDKPFAEVEKVNGQIVKETVPNGVFDYQINKEHLVISKKYLKTGENTLLIKFASPIKTSGAAITRYIDKEDGAEYIYSLFVPSDASTAFPVFDQPDLKARFKLSVDVPNGWDVISNSEGRSFRFDPFDTPHYTFEETEPISTYVFAFAAGDFSTFYESDFSKELTNFRQTRKRSKVLDVKAGKNDKMTTTDGRKVIDVEEGLQIFVRKSQAEKFKQHAAEVFRLNREGVKFLEEYFDYKFPFPKYDLVLIPEFPFGGMEHAGATFLRESSVIFPTEPTKNDYVSRANVIFHEAAHQWFGDTVTMKWFDDLWLKEGFAEFMAYKTLEKVMPEYNAWKIFYERNKQAAYLTDSTKGTTPIYQEIKNLSAAKSAYGNIVYRKAPSFLKQAEFYLGEKEFQTAVRSFLKKHEFANAEWTDLVNEFQNATFTIKNYPNWKEYSAKEKKVIEASAKKRISDWAEYWVRQPGIPIIRVEKTTGHYEKADPVQADGSWSSSSWIVPALGLRLSEPFENSPWALRIKTFYKYGEENEIQENLVSGNPWTNNLPRLFDKDGNYKKNSSIPDLIFPNYQDYGYGIFLLDEKSRAYVLANIQTEKDDFLRAMMWGSLWDSVRETELAPKDYVELVVENISVETDESTIQTLLNRVSTSMNYYLSDKQRDELAPQVENLLIDKIKNAPTLGLRITYYRAFLNVASSDKARSVLRDILNEDLGTGGGNTKMRPGTTQIGGKTVYAASAAIPLKSKDRFDIVTKLLILGDATAAQLLSDLEKADTSDEAKRYAYAGRAGIAAKENKQKFWNDFTNNKEISESWIEAAFVPFNAVRHSDLTLPYLEKALSELPNLKKNRKIFFVNGWLAAFIGGQKSAEALAIINKFLADNPSLDRDLRLKILENMDGLERAVKIREKYGK